MTSALPLPQRYAQHKRAIGISGVIYASPAEGGNTDDPWTYTSRRGIRLLPSQRRPGVRAYLVIGDSMAPTIPDRSIILVESNDAFSPHYPCAFQTPYGLIAKRRGVSRGRPALLSDNLEVEPITSLGGIRPLGRIYAVYQGPYSVKWVS